MMLRCSIDAKLKKKAVEEECNVHVPKRDSESSAAPAAVEENSPTAQLNETDIITPDWEIVESVPGQEKVSNSEATTQGAQQGGTSAANHYHSWSRRSQFKWDVTWRDYAA
ncbi:hypothetical protein LMH87_001053 [Akanthomyces muscarius]|uniref:Uncharacterized protein n=1 Tax=Akanthomyces muscarius TaxID=2231603 RepID=A0A9W8UPD9_AKAMU|nr:hypothetical protein LMH87_001053 [Akanthomyces muscarius]KAJ4155826.1 hypothetical protein LMH87_001053 [Akanthomyces muscarius]